MREKEGQVAGLLPRVPPGTGSKEADIIQVTQQSVLCSRAPCFKAMVGEGQTGWRKMLGQDF